MKARFTIASTLRAPPEDVWRAVSSVRGIAYELRPLVRMTFPSDIEELDETTVPIGERLCRSWLLLFGVLPVDYDDVTIVELDPGRRFLERSSMLSLREWEHERIVEPHGEGTRITDRLVATPRIPLPERVVHGVIRTLFRHRHRRLTRRFGGHSTES